MAIKTHPNQRTIIINRDLPKKTKENQRPYIAAYIDNIAAASKNLNGVAFKLYCYLLSNENYFSLAFSPQDFVNNFGGTVKSAQTAFAELEQKGYIICREKNTFVFCEVSNKQPEAAIQPEIVEQSENVAATSNSRVSVILPSESANEIVTCTPVKRNWKEELM